MAQIFNGQRVRGVRVLDEGATLYNGQRVIGVRAADEGVLFGGGLRTMGVDVLDDVGPSISNDLQVQGVVLIEDDRLLYNGLQVMPAWAVTGVLGELIPLAERAAVFFDNTDAPIGDVTSLQTRGSWGAAFENRAFTGGLIAQMTADGLLTRGNILRNISARGPYTKITILADVLRTGITNGGRGDVLTINPNLAAEFRLYLQFDENRFMVTGPNGVIINMASQWGYGARHVVGVELDTIAGTLTVMEPDGDIQTAAVTGGPLSIGRVEIGKAAASTIYQLALITEPAV